MNPYPARQAASILAGRRRFLAVLYQELYVCSEGIKPLPQVLVARMAGFWGRRGLGFCGSHGGKAVRTDGVDASISVLPSSGSLRRGLRSELCSTLCGVRRSQTKKGQVALAPDGDRFSCCARPYESRFAASAASASRFSVVKNSFG